MGTPVTVKRLGIEDVSLARETIRTIKGIGQSPANPSMDSSDMQAWLSQSSNILIVATHAGLPAGFALGYFLDRVDEARTMLFFYEIEVAVAYRRVGIGRRLVETMKDLAREKGVLKMWVQTSPDNTAARTLYRRTGAVEREGSDLLYVWTSENEGVLSKPSLEGNHQKR